MRLTDEQNAVFVNDPRRIAAEEDLHKIVARIRGALKNDGNAGYYLTVLPQLLKTLEDANDRLIVVEAAVEAEIIEKGA